MSMTPTSPVFAHKISVLVILKSGGGMASTVMDVSTVQLLESTTVIL